MDYKKMLLGIRGNLNLSQEKLGDLLGVSFSTINRWENGKAVPSKLHIFQIEKICKENNIKIK